MVLKDNVPTVSWAANPEKDCKVFDLWGNGWRFEKDHRVAIELSQADSPMFRRNNFPSTIEIQKAVLEIPVAPEEANVDFRKLARRVRDDSKIPKTRDCSYFVGVSVLKRLQPLAPVAAQRLVAGHALAEQQALDAIDVPGSLVGQRLALA